MNPSLFLIGSATPKPFGELGIGPLNLNRVAVTQGYRIAILGGICFADHDFKRRGIHGRHLTRLRPNFSAYLDYRLQKDAALHRNDHDQVGLYRQEYKSRRNWNSFGVQRLMITNDGIKPSRSFSFSCAM